MMTPRAVLFGAQTSQKTNERREDGKGDGLEKTTHTFLGLSLGELFDTLSAPRARRGEIFSEN